MQGIHSTLLEADNNLAERMTAEQHSHTDVDNEKLRHTSSSKCREENAVTSMY
jgi:hypothetical protein